jgi:predicted  nucleic acid-binding Zn-ribbon protein
MTFDSPLELLMEVQQNDVELDQLVHRRANLPERAELKAVEARLAATGERAAGMRSEREALADREVSLESEIESLTSRIAAIENRLFHGDATAFRDQQAMADEVKSLEHRRRGLEDRDLELMEEAEAADAGLTTVEAELSAVQAHRERLLGSISAAEAELSARIEAVRKVRGPLADGLPPDLASDYERLRAKLGAVGAARIAGGSCGGCHLALPAAELDRAKHAPAGTVLHCDQCGRILVP